MVCMSLCTRELAKSREYECQRKCNVRTSDGEARRCVRMCVCVRVIELERKTERGREMKSSEIVSEIV